MVREQFLQDIQDFEKGVLPSYDLSASAKICEEYPCFHSAHLLNAVYLKQDNEQEFNEKLASIAARVLNRSVLYDRVHATFQSTPINSTEVVADQEVMEVLEQATQLQEPELQESEIVQPTNEVEAISDTIHQETENLQELVNAIRKKQLEAPIVSKVAKEDSTLKRHANKEPQLSVPKKKQKEKAKAIAKPKEKSINSFTDWLKNKKAIDPKEIVEKKKTTKKVSDIPIDMSVSNEAALILEGKKSPLKLEDFLVDQIERRQAKKDRGAKRNLHAVSETYAKILANQGKFEDAIKVYKELSIKYPKKSSNFVRQIENLKNSL